MTKPKSAKPVVLRFRIEIERDFYERAKKLGYSLRDLRLAIQEAGLSELSELIVGHEDGECNK